MNSKTKTIVLEFEVTAPAGMGKGAIRREVTTRINDVTARYNAFELGLTDNAETSRGHIRIKAKRYRGF